MLQRRALLHPPLLLLVMTPTAPAAAAAAAAQRNIIHIVVDDLRPELGCFGLPFRHTPTIDALAARGTVFTRAYAQQAVCGPSRNSFLTGRYPDRSRSWNFIDHFRTDHPDWTTLPGLFLAAGRLALGAGKIFHPMLPPAYDGNRSWSPAALPFHNPCWNTADNTSAKFQDGGLPCVFCPIDVSHALRPHAVNVSVANEFCEVDALEDTLSVDAAIRQLRAAAAAGTPFYLAVGLHKPHMPWQYAPEDLVKHPIDSVSLPGRRVPPAGMPPLAFHFTDGSAQHADPWSPVPDNATRRARRAYRAAVTGMDRKLSALLDAVDALGLTGATAVVLHGDHGFALGELGEWRKMSNFEAAAQVPLVVVVPWLAAGGDDGLCGRGQGCGQGGRGQSRGQVARSDAPVQLVDVLPTIADLAGLPLPRGETPFDGVSLVPLLAGASSQARRAAFSQYPRRVTHPSRPWEGNSIIHEDRRTFTHMGYSVRTAAYRYTEWLQWNASALAPVWGNVTARELYDYTNATTFPVDFDAAGADANVAGDPANAATVAELSGLIRDEFQRPAQ